MLEVLFFFCEKLELLQDPRSFEDTLRKPECVALEAVFLGFEAFLRFKTHGKDP